MGASTMSALCLVPSSTIQTPTFGGVMVFRSSAQGAARIASRRIGKSRRRPARETRPMGPVLRKGPDPVRNDTCTISRPPPVARMRPTSRISSLRTSSLRATGRNAEPHPAARHRRVHRLRRASLGTATAPAVATRRKRRSEQRSSDVMAHVSVREGPVSPPARGCPSRNLCDSKTMNTPDPVGRSPQKGPSSGLFPAHGSITRRPLKQRR